MVAKKSSNTKKTSKIVNIDETELSLDKVELKPSKAVAKTVAIPEIQKTDWFKTPSGYTIRFVRVPPMAFNLAKAKLRAKLRENKPEAPIRSLAGREEVVKNDPVYLERLKLWKDQLQDSGNQATFHMLLLAGMEVKEVIPHESKWFQTYFDAFFSVLGYESPDEMFDSFGFIREELNKMYFIQYVVMDEPLLNQLMDYQKLGNSDDEVTAESSVDMFRSDSEQDTA